MTEPADPVRIRIGTAERDAALDALGEHLRAGRLDPEEYGERAQQVAIARYRSELAALFVDLPNGLPAPSRPPGPAPRRVGYVDRRGREPLGGRFGERAVALSPFVALVLFFGVGALGNYGWSWLFFLLVPVAGVVVYGDRHARGSEPPPGPRR